MGITDNQHRRSHSFLKIQCKDLRCSSFNDFRVIYSDTHKQPHIQPQTYIYTDKRQCILCVVGDQQKSCIPTTNTNEYRGTQQNNTFDIKASNSKPIDRHGTVFDIHSGEKVKQQQFSQYPNKYQPKSKHLCHGNKSL